MKSTLLLAQFLLMGLFCTFYSCDSKLEKPIPEKHPDQSKGKYDKYLKLLEEAYDKNDHFNAAIQLANLKGDVDATYRLLELSLNEKQDQCEQIYQWWFLYDRHDFGVNILSYDTVRFKKMVSLCDQLLENDSYHDYAVRKDEENRIAESNKEAEDSTHYNMELINILNQIHDEDQSIREKFSAKSNTPEMKEAFRMEMQEIDSINLVKLEKIFAEHGFPGKSLVGKNASFTAALVIHHSNSLETRYKYLPLLEKAVKEGELGEGTLNMIKRRIESMELDNKQ